MKLITLFEKKIVGITMIATAIAIVFAIVANCL